MEVNINIEVVELIQKANKSFIIKAPILILTYSFTVYIEGYFGKTEYQANSQRKG